MPLPPPPPLRPTVTATHQGPLSTGITQGPAPVVSAAARRELLFAGLTTEVPVSKPPPGYRVAIGLLAGFLILLTTAFVALVAFMGYLVIWHGYNAIASVGTGPYFVFHVPMAVLGALLLVFLIKPIFTRIKQEDHGVVKLVRAREPMLFEFVEKLCAVTGSKPPSVIEVDCEPNASASFQRGISGLLGRKLVLRIGLPLVAAMPVRQLAGVLAHEFGHFNQKHGMFGSMLIRRLMFLFARIVFERDRLDEMLGNVRAAHPIWYYLVVVFIEPARGLLWLMLMIGQSLTCHALRRMEFDADTFEAYVAGTKTFSDTNKLIMLLSIATHKARYDLSRSIEQKRLADDLPRFIVASARTLREKHGEILKHLKEEKTGWLDTHPCHNDRVQAVEGLGAGGTLECSRPASELFTDFPGLCRYATQSLYQGLLGNEFVQVKCVSTQDMLRDRETERAAFKVAHRFFRGSLVVTRPVFPARSAVAPPVNISAAVQELRSLRDAMENRASFVDQAGTAHEDSSLAMTVARAQLQLCSIFSMAPQVGRIRSKANRQLRIHEPKLRRAQGELAAYEDVARRRLTHALCLVHTQHVTATMGPAAAATRADVRRFTPICQALEAHVPAMERLRQLALASRVLCSAHNAQQPYPPLVDAVLKTIGEAREIMRTFKEQLGGMPYPFEHATAGISIGDAVVSALPDAQDPVETYNTAMTAFDRFSTVAFRSLGVLTDAAEKAEIAVGLPRLPEPVEREDKEALEERRQERVDAWKYWIGYPLRAAGGILMIGLLVWLSVDPPALPNMPWSSGAPATYRPAGFRGTSNFDSYRAPPAWNTPGAPGSPRVYSGMPQGPNFPSRTGSGYTPPSPRYTPPTYNPPTYTPPPRYTPPPTYRPTYTPPSGGGGRPGR